MDMVEQLRRAYQAWHDSRGKDFACWLDLVADDVRLDTLGEKAAEMPHAVPRDGKAQIGRYLEELARDWEMIHYTPRDFVADGDRCVMVGRCAWRHRGTGKEVESPLAHYWRFRDGKAVEYFEFFDTASAVAAATPDPAAKG